MNKEQMKQLLYSAFVCSLRVFSASANKAILDST